MNRKVDILTAKNAFVASLFLAAIILAFLAPRAAVNVDEQLHYPHAKQVVNWYFTAGEDASCLETPVTNLKYYGQSVDNFTALINRVFNIENEFLTRHFTGALFFWLLLLFAGLIAFQLSGSFWVSTLTVFSVIAMPRLFGQAFGNLKDIPFATGYLAGIFMIIRFIKELPKPGWKSSVFLGLAIAFTISVRIGGLILFGYLAVAIIAALILKPFLPKYIFSTKSCLVRLLGQGLAILLIGYFAGLFFWPFALQNIFQNPLESLQLMEHYKVSIRQIFEGEWLWSTQLPWYYLPKWLMISTPEFIIFGFAVFLTLFLIKINKQDSKQLFTGLFLLFTLFFPIIYVIAIKANLYSGVRQMIFVLPLFTVFSAAGIWYLLNSFSSKLIKSAVVIVYFILMILPLKHQVTTFPADYIYFNSISGGNKKAWSNYEYDYYFHGIKSSSEYVIDLIGSNNVTLASNCNLSNYFEKSTNIKYKYSRYLERSSVDWDYGLFGINYIHPDLLKSGKWNSTEIVKTFYHAGNPIVVLLKRKDKTDLQGIEKSENGDFDKAQILLESAVKNDENNVWLYLQMAKNSLKQNDFETFNRYLQKGRAVYPHYEPFYLLEAQHHFNQKDYREAKFVLDELIEINPRYGIASHLIEKVNEKLNSDKLN
jgi:tetratricopeptide (TPR) repeat protein